MGKKYTRYREKMQNATNYAAESAVTLKAHQETMRKFMRDHPHIAVFIKENDEILLFPGQDVFDNLEKKGEPKHIECPPPPLRRRH